MTHIIATTCVEETLLWKILSKREDSDAKFLSPNVAKLCGDASERMKLMYSYAPQYTLHDELHLLRTTELMGMILGAEAEKLNNAELALLILSAFFHDQGMVISNEEFTSLNSNEDYKLFRDNWIVEHPNYEETIKQINLTECSEEYRKELAKKISELDSALLTDYIRESHGKRSFDYIQAKYGNERLIEIQQVNLAHLLATLCRSHTWPGEELTPQNEFHYDEQIGRYTVNLPFLAVVLRLADILDFDRDRTPEVLLKSIHFTSQVSLLEWEKHRSVIGWTISPQLIRFSMQCEYPEYEAAARYYMDWIDKELTACHNICRMQPQNIPGYRLNLPATVDRSRIKALNNAYRFHDLEFSLSRDEIVKLLMTDELYSHPHLCIRELLQNSLDALRYRKALFAHQGVTWEEGKVEFRHFVNSDGYEVLECSDNGAGMDEEIIRNHFAKIGRSFYRSPLFERERNNFKISGHDFDPCSKFGIGFMSCFMLGDRITIKTRKDYGHGKKSGPPLIVEIHGLSGLLIVKNGTTDQPEGTTVTIISRKKPTFLDPYIDQINLCSVLEGYALATEFPIIGHCEISEIKEFVTIPNKPEIAKTLLEFAKIKHFITFHQDLSQISPQLNGFIRESVLIDNNGLPCIENSEAKWICRKLSDLNLKYWHIELLKTKEKFIEYTKRSTPICIDGILVTGEPGRFFNPWESHKYRVSEHSSTIRRYSPALVDARGELKPEVTPARTPPDGIMFYQNKSFGWKRLKDIIEEGFGLLWERLANYLLRGMSPEVFWKLVIIHEIPITEIPYDTLWRTLPVMLTKNGEETKWKMIRELGEIFMLSNVGENFILKDKHGFRVGADKELQAWVKNSYTSVNISTVMKLVTISMSDLDIHDGKVILYPSSYNAHKLERLDSAFTIHELFYRRIDYVFVDFTGTASNALAIETSLSILNKNHSLVNEYLQAKYVSIPTDLQAFVRNFVKCVSRLICRVELEEKPSLEKPNYDQKCLGHQYFAINWDKYDQSLRPPYKLWTKKRGWFWLGEEDFAKWRDAKV